MSLSAPTQARTPRTVATLALVLAGAALAGCIGSYDAATATGSFYVKDDPTDELSAVHVTFTSAEAQAVGGDWAAFFEGNRTIELLSLNASDARELLGSAELAAGDYTALRVTLSDVTVTDLEGNATPLTLLNDTVTVSEGFTVTEGGDFAILVDFGLDEGIDLENGTYTPYVASVQHSQDDSDDDGLDDILDTDDDGDGIEDAFDDDLDGDGEDDEPDQRHGPSEDALDGLCNAWSRGGLGQNGHAHGHDQDGDQDGNETDGGQDGDANGTHRDHPVRAALERFAAADNATIDAFCLEHSLRGDDDDEDDDHPGRGRGQGRGHDAAGNATSSARDDDHDDEDEVEDDSDDDRDEDDDDREEDGADEDEDDEDA
ncbi:MAG: DUF4382 domain-containing protein [Thermoplasmatota archaeon]